MKKIVDFFKKSVFYLIDPEEKQYVKKHVMLSNHKTHCGMLIFIFLMQLVMIGFTFISSGFNPTGDRIIYICCYAGLMAIIPVFYFLIDFYYTQDRPNAYFVVVGLSVLAFFTWATIITFLDCDGKTQLTTFAYVSLSLCLVMILEPWVFITGNIIFLTALNIALVISQNGIVYSSAIIGSLSIFILSSVGAVINFYRHTNLIKLEKEVRTLNTSLFKRVHKDDLTGLFNRRYLTEHIDDILKIGAKPTIVIMMDIDDFKLVNDEYGHVNGDLCLEKLGEHLNKLINDFVGAYCVRYGGEEFLINIPSCSREAALDFANKIRETFAQNPIVLSDGSVYTIKLSIGVAIAKSNMNYAALINAADSLLYEAKTTGKDKIVCK